MESETMLAQDLCARLCHDLVGPLGTVAGALDMLADDPEAAALARDAAADMRRRLKFWRTAYGGGAGGMAVSEFSGLLDGLLAGGRARLELDGFDMTEVLPAPVAQMLLVAALLAGEALPRGGVVTLAREGKALLLRPEGRVVAWPDALIAALDGRVAQGPREVPAGILARLSRASGWRPALAWSGEAEVLRIAPPI